MTKDSTLRKGDVNYPNRVPPGWRVAAADRWLINNADPGEPDYFAVQNWSLEISGDVDTPLHLSYEQLQKLPHVTRKLDHHCIDGWSFLGQAWNGVELSVIKEKAVVSTGARYVLAEGAGGISQNFSIDDDLLLADGQDGAPLTKSTGYPLRIVAPGQFGNRSVKWLKRLEFTEEREMDSRDRKYESCGILGLYNSAIRDKDPWTVDNTRRKEFLCSLFASNTDARRKKKRDQHMMETQNKVQQSSVSRIIRDHDETPEIFVCNLKDLMQDGSPSKFVINGFEVLLLKTNDELYAIEPMCTHHGTDLTRGRINLNARTIRCPLHGAYFDLKTGRCLLGSNGCDGDAFPNTRIYRHRVRSGKVYIDRKQEWGHI